MRKNFGAKAIIYPMPVLFIGTYDENGKPNAMNAATRAKLVHSKKHFNFKI